METETLQCSGIGALNTLRNILIIIALSFTSTLLATLISSHKIALLVLPQALAAGCPPCLFFPISGVCTYTPGRDPGTLLAWKGWLGRVDVLGFRSTRGAARA